MDIVMTQARVTSTKPSRGELRGLTGDALHAAHAAAG
jgi:hypothetical protein